MGNIVTKVPLKDGTIRYFADAEVRQRVAELAQEAITQVETLPAPAASIVNQTFQYIGPTTENYVHNAFYTVVEGEEPGTYVYEQTVYTTQEINEIISGENLNNFRILYDDTEQPDTSAPATIELIDSIYRYTYVTIEEWTYGEDTTNITIYDGYNKPNAPTTIDGYNISLDGKTLTRIAATGGDVVIVKITGTRFGANGVIIDLEDRVVDLENEDTDLKKRIGNLTDALGDNELYPNYITDKTGIIVTENTMPGGSPIITSTFDTALKEFSVSFKWPSGITPAYGNCKIFSGDDLFETKLSKNLPNGNYTFYGDYLGSTSSVYFSVYGQNEGDQYGTRIFISTGQTYSFTIDNTYEYNWVEIYIDTLTGTAGFQKPYKVTLLKDGETIKETMARPKVPKYDAAFTDHQYTFSPSTDVDGAIHVVEEWNWPRDLYPDEQRDNTRTADVKPKGWDNLQKIMQYSTMPAPTAAQVGKIVQYQGPTNATYTNGYFYKCAQNPDAAVPGEYTGPDGNVYEYMWAANVYDDDYAVYSHYPFCYWTQRVQSTDKPYLLTGVSENNIVYLGQLGTRQGSYYASFTSFYPQSISNDTDVLITRNGGAMHADWSWAVPTSVYESTNTEGFDTEEECFAYLTASAYVWEQVDTQPEYTLPIASDSTLGGIKVGNNLSIDENGVLSGTASYELPVATPSTLGGVKIGDNVNVDANGTISVAAPTSIKTVNSVSIGTVTTETEIASFPFYPTSVGNGDALIINGLVSGLVAVTGLAAEITIKVKLDGTDYFTFKQTCDAGYVTIPVTCSIPMTSPAANHVATVTVTATDGSITL